MDAWVETMVDLEDEEKDHLGGWSLGGAGGWHFPAAGAADPGIPQMMLLRHPSPSARPPCSHAGPQVRR